MNKHYPSPLLPSFYLYDFSSSAAQSVAIPLILVEISIWVFLDFREYQFSTSFSSCISVALALIFETFN